MGFLAAGTVTLAWILAAFWWFPTIFNAVKSMFESHDLGIIAGFIVAFITLGPFLFLALVTVTFVYALVKEFTK